METSIKNETKSKVLHNYEKNDSLHTNKSVFSFFFPKKHYPVFSKKHEPGIDRSVSFSTDDSAGHNHQFKDAVLFLFSQTLVWFASKTETTTKKKTV